MIPPDPNPTLQWEDVRLQVALDYYRILMLPLQVEDDQVTPAYQQRLTQPIWRGYSAAALASRQELLAEAHSILSDPTQRHEYDTHLKAVNPSLELLPRQLVGGLIILCEIGDYERALVGAETLVQQEQAKPGAGMETGSHYPDLVLTVAIARLSLGRDQWQQGDYEAAAQQLQDALDDLMNQQAFPEVQADVITDLHKLRPYRILKLLSQPLLAVTERQQGLTLLREMLDERLGIEGQGQDGSGLSSEDFLRFIQKTRSLMTVNEQQALFEVEAQRPSLVASYLAIYALLARGYTENRPALIRQARTLLTRQLARHQDVYLEQAICSLLLGQPEEATRLLAQSQDQEALGAIAQLAPAEDPLPGLCRYIETWFATEVFPEYAHLQTGQVSLKSYFDNPQVQAYLDEMPLDEDLETPAGAGLPSFPTPEGPPPSPARPQPAPMTAPSPPPVYTPVPFDLPASRAGGGMAESPEPGPPRGPRPSRRPVRGESESLPPWVLRVGGFALVLLCLGLGWRVLQALFTNPPAPPAEQPQVQLEQPPVPIPAPPTAPASAPGPLTTEGALQAIQAWQAAKQEAMGQNYNIGALDAVLAEPMLSQWRSRAQQAQNGGGYYAYTLRNVAVEEVIPGADENTASAVTNIDESADYWVNNTRVPGASYNSSYRVRYSLIRRESGAWVVSDFTQL